MWYMFVSVEERMGLVGTRMLMVRVPGTEARAIGSAGPAGSLCFAAEWWKPRLLSRTDKH